MPVSTSASGFPGKNRLFTLILIALLYSLVPIGEIMLFFALGRILGPYPVLVSASLTGVAGVLLALRQMRAARKRLSSRIKAGAYPGREFADISGIIVAGVLLLTPGFVTDCAGFVLMVPPVRRAVGRFLARRLGSAHKDIFAYLRLKNLE